MGNTRTRQAPAPAPASATSTPPDAAPEATVTVRSGNPDFTGTRCGVAFEGGVATGVAASTAALLASEFGFLVSDAEEAQTDGDAEDTGAAAPTE